MSLLINFLQKRFKKFGNLNAIKFGNKLVTYNELSSKALLMASVLLKHKASNEGVVIAGQRSLAAYYGVLASIYSGCYWVPVNTKYSHQRINSIFSQTKIRFVIGSKKDVQIIINKINKKNFSNIKCIIIPDEKTNELKFSSLIENNKNINLALKKPLEINDAELAYLIYTSGSTGVPKGVCVTRSNLYSWLKNMKANYKISKSFNASQTYDLSFDLSVADIFFTWANGSLLCVMEPEEQLIPFDYILREKIQFWSSVPTIIMLMDKMDLLKPNIFPEIKRSLFCGEPLTKSIADKWQRAAPNSTIENLYGPTEATIWLTRYIYSKNKKRISKFHNNILPIGKPFKDHKMRIVDDNNKLMPSGKIGEIVFTGPQITKGYFNDKNKTNEVFTKFSWDKENQIWYKSGDIGFINKEKVFECIGRKDSQFKFAGRRVEIGEIETELRKYKELKDVIIIPIRDESNLVKEIVAFKTKNLKKSEEEIIRKKSQISLEKIFFPSKIITIKSFPLTASGKIDKNILKNFIV